MIQLKNVSKSFGREKVLRNLSVEIFKGEVVVVIGPSGSGKSTFIRLLNGLEIHESGIVKVCEEELKNKASIDRVRKKVGMVFQSFNLFPHLNILDNVGLGLKYVKKESKVKADEVSKKILERVGLLPYIHKFPHELSGGQQQRVAIARSLALQPEILLFDEPTSALDPEMTGEVLSVIKELANSGMTLVIVTHEMAFAQSVGHRILFFDQGTIIEDRRPEEFFNHPQTDRAKKFLENHN